jgi:hypothetical protein
MEKSAKVVGKNVLHMVPGGTYRLNDNNEIEQRVINLHLLAMFADIAADELCENGECLQTLFGPRMEQLGEDIFDRLAPYIKAGVDIFSHTEYYNNKKLTLYDKRPIENGYLNATEEETIDGLPNGWWYEFPCQCSKMFKQGLVAVDYGGDNGIQVSLYSNAVDKDTYEIYFISKRGDYSAIFKHFDAAFEIVQACEFIYNEYHI